MRKAIRMCCVVLAIACCGDAEAQVKKKQASRTVEAGDCDSKVEILRKLLRETQDTLELHDRELDRVKHERDRLAEAFAKIVDGFAELQKALGKKRP